MAARNKRALAREKYLAGETLSAIEAELDITHSTLMGWADAGQWAKLIPIIKKAVEARMAAARSPHLQAMDERHESIAKALESLIARRMAKDPSAADVRSLTRSLADLRKIRNDIAEG